jgi:capsular polysaccharide biosynthesis protein
VRTEHEAPRTVVDPLPDLDEEREIDFGRLGRTILNRWWIVAAAVALGVIVGYLTSVGGGDVFVARTTLYLGQPTSPSGNAQLPSLGTNPATVNEIIKSEEVVQRVAGEVGVEVGRLRRGITSRTVTPAQQTVRQGQNPLILLSVRGPWRRETAEAANLLPTIVIDRVSRYVNAKVDALDERLAAQNRQLEEIDRRIAAHERRLAQAGLSDLQELTLLNLMGLAEQRRGFLIEDRTDTEQLLTLAEEVERAAQVNRAVPSRVPAQSPRSAIVVGGLIGLLAGLVLALAWDPLVGRRPRRRA